MRWAFSLLVCDLALLLPFPLDIVLPPRPLYHRIRRQSRAATASSVRHSFLHRGGAMCARRICMRMPCITLTLHVCTDSTA